MENRQTVSRRSALLLGAVAAGTIISGISGATSAIAADNLPVVVELFTSQGCSSCPPADKLLGELSKQRNLIPLTFNVDYWDYLGWRDTLGSNEHTKRQKQYAANRGTRQVYTPQMIVNGHVDVVGSRRGKVLSALKKESASGPRVPMTISENSTEIIINVADSPTPALVKKATIWVMVTSPKVAVPVKRGENRGKSIVYHNVVRQMIPAGMWNGKAIRITLPKDGLGMKGSRDCIALLQLGNVGKVIGAVRMSDQRS